MDKNTLKTAAYSETLTSGVFVRHERSEASVDRSFLRTTTLPRLHREGEGEVLVQEDKIRYEALDPLGEGGMGEVVLVKDHDIRRRVAMKRLKSEHRKASSLRRFLDEIQTIGRLEHPNIVPIYDAGMDEEGQCFFIMKYLEGETLESILQKLQAGDKTYHARFPLEVRLQILLDVLQGVRFAHSKGVIHRDLKPSNIMVGRYDEISIVDWGLAKALGDDPGNIKRRTEPMDPSKLRDEDLSRRLSETVQGELMGTPAYMSPEQALGGDHVDERTDVFALGVVAYELLTLQHPFEHKKGLMGLLFAIVNEEVTFASFVSSPHQRRVPAELGHVMAKSMSKRPEDRYQGVDEMIFALQQVISGEFPVQCPTTLAKRMTFKVGRLFDHHPFIALTAAPLVLLGLLGMTGLALYGLVSACFDAYGWIQGLLA